MMMRLIYCVLILIAAHTAAYGQGVDAPDERPNVIVIMVDDLGYSDLGSYGAAQIRTPNLDRLADQGIRFTQFYNNAKCSESRASLLTGLYWQQTQNLERNNHVTIAEAVQEAGYHTMWVGKWHVAGEPSDRGFDRTFGFLNGAINFFTGVGTGGQTDNWRLDGEPFEVPRSDFYATHAFTRRAASFIRQADGQDQPFFMYLAYNAPHYPLQAPEETVERYRRQFTAGWDSLREVRHERQVQMGLLPEKWQVTPRNATPAPQYPEVPAWKETTMERKWSEDLKMAVYAAMVEEMDRGVGRLMDTLEQLGEKENTLVMFMSDNGGCPFPKTRTPGIPPGPGESFHNYDTPWANVSNTPFRGYKRQAFEGGSATPFIVSWPAVIGREQWGTTTDAVGHLIDLMPTVLDAAAVEYPSQYGDREVLPMEGQSLMPVFEGRDWSRPEPLFWEYARHAAVRQDDWKLVAFRDKAWELYDMSADRTELNDLSDNRSDKREELVQMYTDWANRVGAAFPDREQTGASQ